jgi:repressor LexA
MRELSRRQGLIMAAIRRAIAERGVGPTVRELAAACGITSTSVVDYNLKILERRGLIARRHDGKARSITLPPADAPSRAAVVTVPLVGKIAAGAPIPLPDDLAAGEFADVVALSRGLVGERPGELFALTVLGHSMVDALVNDGDVVVLRRQDACEEGEVVAVWLRREGETTLKKLYHEPDGQIRLQPANVTMQPVYRDADDVAVQGKLVAVLRSVI